MDESSRRGVDSAREFLETLQGDERLKRRLDQIVDDQILSATRLVAAERGFDFDAHELQEAVIERLALVEFEFDADGGAGKCKSDSGCRTPCVYCKSNQTPTVSDLGNEIMQRRI